MKPAERRGWRWHVAASVELRPSERLVLLMLQEFASYEDGTGARPGVDVLAAACGGLSRRTVDRALNRGMDLGLIVRTADATWRKAAVYKLTIPPDSASPVTHYGTDSAPPVTHYESDSAPPVTHYGARNAPPVPTQCATGDASTYQEQTHTGVLRNRGTSPELSIAAHTDPPPRFCDKHPHGTRGKCGDCANARTAFQAWQALAAERDVILETGMAFERRRRQQIIDNCPNKCAENHGRIETIDAAGDHALEPCDHGLGEAVSNA